MAVSVLDASVLIAFLRPEDDLHGRARAALSEIADSEWVVPTSVCAEMLVRAYRHSDEAAALIDQFLDEGVDRVEPMTLDIARSAARIRAEFGRLSLGDAFVLATGRIVEADHILTSDRAWSGVDDRVRVV
jgi:predicted nucleic acid-binding protein